MHVHIHCMNKIVILTYLLVITIAGSSVNSCYGYMLAYAKRNN